MEDDVKIVLLNMKEFQEEVNNYKEHLNNPNYYIIKEEVNPLIIYQELIEKKDDLEYTSLVNKAIDVFGTDVVEIE